MSRLKCPKGCGNQRSTSRARYCNCKTKRQPKTKKKLTPATDSWTFAAVPQKVAPVVPAVTWSVSR